MNVPPEKPARTLFRRRQYGVYLLTYEDPFVPFMLRINSLLDQVREIRETAPYVRRFLVDTAKLVPVTFVTWLATTAFGVISPAVNLYFLQVLFDMLGDSSAGRTLHPEVYRSLAAWWIFYNMVRVFTERLHTNSGEVMMERFREFYLPQLIRASLNVDVLSIQDLHSIVSACSNGAFESLFPGECFFQELSCVMARTLRLTSHLLVLLYAISRKPRPEREVLLCLCIARALISWLAPFNDIGSSAYIYWSTNRHFQRMKTIYNLAFSIPYRADLMLDDIASSIETEYVNCMNKIGDVKVLEPVPWRSGLNQSWYWNILTSVILDCPVAVYAMTFSANHALSTISSIVLLQEFIGSMLSNTGRHFYDSVTLLKICRNARRFYRSIGHQSTMPQGTDIFPRPIEGSNEAGMKISFSHISLRYPGRDHDALCDVSFDILPGELVLVVGTNGSGKSTMLKLLARLFDPTAGSILIDDLPLVRYDMQQLRSAMAFQSQTPVVYPFTVRENIAIGLPLTSNIEQGQIEEAAKMGGCSEWISKLTDGYDTQLEPLFDINSRWIDDIYGSPSAALYNELERHRDRLVSISGGEKQRLASARTFLRTKNCTTRLVVVDEATSSLDPVAERDILAEIRKMRAGKTIIFVTHRFHHLAREADRILCMQDGTIVENGTHADLIRAGGAYAALYHAQVEQTD